MAKTKPIARSGSKVVALHPNRGEVELVLGKSKGRIPPDTPVGEALYGASPGDTRTVRMQDGSEYTLEVTSVTRARAAA
ncbi:MAG: GreA/GreB family elongation factor [Patescibacteria group bacterium]